MKKTLIILLSAMLCMYASAGDFCLNGSWDCGVNRRYTSSVTVPGIHVDVTRPVEGTLWYRRDVILPDGDWTDAVLELKGARFRPKVYVDGALVSSQEGGMIRSFHPLSGRNLRPGGRIRLEIELASLADTPSSDASFIPKVDQWRSNCASSLWDDVVLHLFRGSRTDRLLSRCDSQKKRAVLTYRVKGAGASSASLEIRHGGKAVVSLEGPAAEGDNSVSLDYEGLLGEWSPENPNLYEITVTLKDAGGKEVDHYVQHLGLREFKVSGKQFRLNGEPLKLRGGTVVWHRWMRDPEGLELGWDAPWFKENIAGRLKEHGANMLRFHLGVPPERLLDLCDSLGLAVQYEWSFFHGAPASRESMEDQYAKWFDMASRHPSVLLFHPYNETEGEQLKTVWGALDSVLPQYEPLVLEERDVIHIHKYWWSLFENLGLYYDSFDEFPKAIMVDEFGGNYLDGKADMGLYPSVRESFMRFLGPEHDAAMRLHHLDRSCAKVAEYWRRLDAAGVSPFVIASSQEDGCNWFLGPLKEGRPKNVWNALTVLWSSRALSMDIWDANFTPGQKVRIPLHAFNDTPDPVVLEGEISVLDGAGDKVTSVRVPVPVKAYGHSVKTVSLRLPRSCGSYVLRAETLNPGAELASRVLSDWDVRVLKAEPSFEGKIYIPRRERELRAFARRQGLRRCCRPSEADVILTGAKSWPITAEDGAMLEEAVGRGASVVLLDVGEKGLGQGYPARKGDLGPLQGVQKVKDPEITHYPMFCGLSMTCTEMAEPESHIHPLKGETRLWEGLPREGTSLWNGLRGGLLVPAADMEIGGLNSEAFLKQWISRGADADAIVNGSCYAYDLCGFYAYDDRPDNRKVIADLRERVRFLVEDAPALALSLNPKAPVRVSNLSEGYKASLDGQAVSFEPLCCAGKNLTRTPVVMIGFGEGKGKVVISQLITAGRLAKSGRKSGPWDVRYDEDAAGTVLNMINLCR